MSSSYAFYFSNSCHRTLCTHNHVQDVTIQLTSGLSDFCVKYVTAGNALGAHVREHTAHICLELEQTEGNLNSYMAQIASKKCF